MDFILRKKEEVMELMLNAVDRYTTVQGTFRMKGKQMGCESEASVEYKIDKGASYSYERVCLEDIDWMTLADDTKVTIYYHAQKAYRTTERTKEIHSWAPFRLQFYMNGHNRRNFAILR